MNGNTLDWMLMHSFAAVAEAGSLSAAARQLGHSQPTLGRHIRALEAAVGGPVFTRHPGGLHLTDLGRKILPAAQDMAAAAARAALAIAGQDPARSGTVRVTASMVIAHFHLPSILADLHAKAPRIAVDLVASDSSDNLLFGAADIAVRMYRPTQLDLITRHLGTLELGLYATRGYLDDAEPVLQFDDLTRHRMLGYDRSDLMIRAMRAMGHPVGRDFFALRCDDQAAYVQMIRAGCGIGVTQTSVAATMPELVRVLPEVPLPTLPVWLTRPGALRDVPRVRLVFDHLASALTPLCAAPRVGQA